MRRRRAGSSVTLIFLRLSGTQDLLRAAARAARLLGGLRPPAQEPAIVILVQALGTTDFGAVLTPAQMLAHSASSARPVSPHWSC
jgi:hypothetical protein